MLKQSLLLTSSISFITGAVILGYELAVSRLVAPYFGNSVYTWGILLSIVMASLSLGYMIGGKIADKTKKLRPALAMIVFFSGILLLLSYYSGNWLLEQSLVLLSIQSSGWGYITVLSAAMLVSFAPAMILLGLISPILLKLSITQVGVVGNRAGTLSMMGSIGGIIGALGTSFGLIPSLGVHWSILFFSIVMSASALLLTVKKNFKIVIISSLIIFCMIGVVSFLGKSRLADLIQIESLYNHITLFFKNNVTYMSTGSARAVQSQSLSRSGVMGSYLDYFALSPLLTNQEKPQSVLLIGVAGGTVIKQLNLFFPDQLKIDAVEIDPKMVDLAKQYFELTDDEANLVVAEGRQYLSTTNNRYDIILVDAFSTDVFAPSHLMTSEFFLVAKEKLNPGGVLLYNVISPETSESGSTLYSAISQTILQQFQFVSRISLQQNSEALGNHVLIASSTVLAQEIDTSSLPTEAARARAEEFLQGIQPVSRNSSSIILTDDKNPVEYLYWQMIGK